jgi:Asp-tRNA(Asn)/Glu-tRNA(Gln) amidotransferase A subunit family amidase
MPACVVSTRVGSASFAPDFYESAKQAQAALPESDTSLAAERLRGIALSHRDWLMADGGRTRLRAQWRELFKTFDAVICAVMPTPAYPHSLTDSIGENLDGCIEQRESGGQR